MSSTSFNYVALEFRKLLINIKTGLSSRTDALDIQCASANRSLRTAVDVLAIFPIPIRVFGDVWGCRCFYVYCFDRQEWIWCVSCGQSQVFPLVRSFVSLLRIGSCYGCILNKKHKQLNVLKIIIWICRSWMNHLMLKSWSFVWSSLYLAFDISFENVITVDVFCWNNV